MIQIKVLEPVYSAYYISTQMVEYFIVTHIKQWRFIFLFWNKILLKLSTDF